MPVKDLEDLITKMQWIKQIRIKKGEALPATPSHPHRSIYG